MEPEPRIIRKRVKLRKRSFFKREIMNVSYREILIFIIFGVFFILLLFYKVIYNYLAGIQ